MDCLELYVSGIDARATDYQVLSYFKSFSEDVQSVKLLNSTVKGQQSAIVYFSRYRTIEDVIKMVNFKVIDNLLVRCNLNNVYLGNEIPDERTKVILQFPHNYNMDVLTHRKIFEIMEVCGPILNISILKNQRRVIVQFISEKSAKAALSSSCNCGVKIYQNSPIQQQQMTKEKFKPYVPINNEKKPYVSTNNNRFKPYVPSSNEKKSLFVESDFPSFETVLTTSSQNVSPKEASKSPSKGKAERTNSTTAI